MDSDLKKPLLDKEAQPLSDEVKGNEERKSRSGFEADMIKQAAEMKKTQDLPAVSNKKDELDDFKSYGICYTLCFMTRQICKQSHMAKIQLLITVILTLATKVLSVIHPVIFKFIIDELIEAEFSYFLIIAYISVRLVAECSSALSEISFASISATAEIQVAELLYDHVQNQSLHFHVTRQTGKVVRICSKGSESFAKLLRYACFLFIPMFLEIGLMLGAIATFFPIWFLILVIVCIIAYIADTVIVTEWRAKHFKSMNIKDTAYVQKFTDSLINFETVKYFNAEEHERKRYYDALNEYKQESVNTSNSMVLLNISQSVLLLGCLLLNLLLALYMINRNELKIGDFVLLNSYILQVYGPLFFLGTYWRFIKQSRTDVDQVFQMLEHKDIIEEAPDAEHAKGDKGEIEFENVSFAYDKNASKMLIDGISFKIDSGQSIALVGATGAGKSTIMRLLYRFYDVLGGRILIDGQDISKLKIDELRSKIAIVPQDTALFNDTMKYNIAYGGVSDPDFKKLMEDPYHYEQYMALVTKAAEDARILKFIERKQDGFDMKVGERGLKLSGGEKQRVAIARALLKKSPIMLFDEATSSLDTATEKQIELAIKNASENTTTLIIAHRLSTIKGCDKIIVLKQGKIVEQGTHEELYELDGEYKFLWDKQQEKEHKEQCEANQEEQEESEGNLTMKKTTS